MSRVSELDSPDLENYNDEADAPSGSEKSESGTKRHDDENSKYSASDSDDGRDLQIPSIDEQIEKIGFGHFQRRCLVLFCLIMTSRGTEFVCSYLLPSYLLVLWNLDSRDYRVQTWISFGSYCMGTVLGGVLSDKYGRHIVLLASGSGFMIATFCRAISPDWYMYCAMHLVGEFCAGCELPIVLSLAYEFIPRSWRAESLVALIGSGVFFGSMLIYIINNLIVLAFNTPMPNDWWRFLVAWSALPHTVSVAMLWSNTPESPRWLLTKGRRQLCSSLLKFIAEENHTESQLIADGEVRVRSIVNYEISLRDVMSSTTFLYLWLMSTVCMTASLLLVCCDLQSSQSDAIDDSVSDRIWYSQSTVPLLQPIIIALSMFMTSVFDLHSSIFVAYGLAGCFCLGTSVFWGSGLLGVAINRVHLCFIFASGYQALALAIGSFPTAFRSTFVGLCCSIALVSGACMYGLIGSTERRVPLISYPIMSVVEAAMSVLILQVPSLVWTKANQEWPD
jgi:MFS family permease